MGQDKQHIIPSFHLGLIGSLTVNNQTLRNAPILQKYLARSAGRNRDLPYRPNEMPKDKDYYDAKLDKRFRRELETPVKHRLIMLAKGCDGMIITREDNNLVTRYAHHLAYRTKSMLEVHRLENPGISHESAMFDNVPDFTKLTVVETNENMMIGFPFPVMGFSMLVNGRLEPAIGMPLSARKYLILNYGSEVSDSKVDYVSETDGGISYMNALRFLGMSGVSSEDIPITMAYRPDANNPNQLDVVRAIDESSLGYEMVLDMAKNEGFAVDGFGYWRGLDASFVVERRGDKAHVRVTFDKVPNDGSFVESIYSSDVFDLDASLRKVTEQFDSIKSHLAGISPHGDYIGKKVDAILTIKVVEE